MKETPVCEDCGRSLDKDEVALSLAAYGVLLCYDHLEKEGNQ